MSKAPCYQRYPSDFFGDSKVRIMSSDARAYYSLLLDCIWDFDTQYSIPNDDDLISKLLCIDIIRWQKISQEIISCLQVKSGRLISCRLKREKEKQDKYRKLQSIKGKAGGRPRKSPGLTPALPEESLPLPLPIPILIKKKKPPISPNGDFELFWKSYPRKESKGAAEKAWAKVKPDKELLEKILLSIEQHMKTEQWMKENGAFIPYAQKFLNNKYYEDEVKEKPVNTGYSKPWPDRKSGEWRKPND